MQVGQAGRGDGGSSAQGITESMRALSMETMRYVDDVARVLGHHRSDVAALGALIEADRRGVEVTPSELAHEMSLSLAAVTALVDRLERAGHLCRRRHVDDGRKVVLELTDRARETSRFMFLPLAERMCAQLAGYSAEELDVVARALADLLVAAESARPPSVEVTGSGTAVGVGTGAGGSHG
ncbi:MarR family winged helix-turn-helix transcriptional regulator [Austwickia chelonae]|uniref:MarR family winged helix-turn-helix transcriptional regulator n=1 Tax=Austwickia chelonae TaxID=100225 RepID=UPI000E23A8F7|nr:MarR family transcriptional regulator [Austwickia chelonae]